MLDLILAGLHHLLFVGLIAMLAAQAALLRLEAPPLGRLAGIDAGYGLAALMLVAVGFSRAIWSARGWDFYAGNPFFWTKIAAFAAVGLVSVGSTLLFLKWRRAGRLDAAFAPPARDLKRARQWKMAEMGLVALIVVLAAAMARWPF